MGDQANDEQMLTTRELAKWLGIAERTVCTWAECGELPARKLGRQWRFRRTEISSWLTNSQRQHFSAFGLGTPAAKAAAAAYSFNEKPVKSKFMAE